VLGHPDRSGKGTHRTVGAGISQRQAVYERGDSNPARQNRTAKAAPRAARPDTACGGHGKSPHPEDPTRPPSRTRTPSTPPKTSDHRKAVDPASAHRPPPRHPLMPILPTHDPMETIRTRKLDLRHTNNHKSDITRPASSTQNASQNPAQPTVAQNLDTASDCNGPTTPVATTLRHAQ